MTVRPARLNAAIAWLFMVGLGVLRARVGAGLPRRRRWAGSTASPTSSGRSSSPSPRTASWCRRRAPATTGVDAVTQHRPAPVRLLGLAPARPQLAGRGHPVPRHAVLQHQHHRGPDPQRDRRRVRPLRVAPGLLRVGALPRRPARSASSPSRPVPRASGPTVAAVADRLAQHARLGALHGVGARQLRPARAPTRCWTRGRRRGHPARRPVLPHRRGPDVPGVAPRRSRRRAAPPDRPSTRHTR